MKKGKKPVILEKLLIEDYAAEGKSLARVNGKVIFVENTVPGDVVDVQLYKNKKDWAEGFPLQFHEFSCLRIQPFCQHFGVCGGCQWQMLPYEKQLEYKQQQVADNLQRIGKIKLPEIFPILGCDETRYYRNKLEYAFSAKQYIPENEFRQMLHNGIDINEKNKKNVAGFFARGTFDKAVEIIKCHLQQEPTNEIRNAVAEYARENNFSFYDYRQHTGWLRSMFIRMTTTDEIMVNLVFGYEDEKARIQLLEFVLKQFPQITTLLHTINSKRNDNILDLSPQPYSGKGYIIEKLEEFIFKISAKSFFQTNTKQAQKLYSVAKDFAELTLTPYPSPSRLLSGERGVATQTVYDLYCGTGSIGIFLSKQAKKIIGVEINRESVADAKENAKLNNIINASFYSGDVIDICNDDFFEANGKPDVIITDPPRAGMHEKLVKKLLEIAAPVIVYVSCNAATQARDLYLLGEKYSVEKIQPVDMFPHTHHIENVVQLKIKTL